MENFLKKLATNSLNMAVEEYELMRDEGGQEWVIDEIQKRCQEKGLAVPNVRSLKESLQKDQTVAARTHSEWQPSQVSTSFFIFVEMTISLCDTPLFTSRFRPCGPSLLVLLREGEKSCTFLATFALLNKAIITSQGHLEQQ